MSEQTVPDRMLLLAREFKNCRSAFTALGDENRQYIVIALLENYGGMRVGELTKCTNLSRPAVSHHLKILKEAGIVSLFKKGTMNFYHIDANGSKWEPLMGLMEKIQSLLADISEKRKYGDCCDIIE